MATRKTTRAKYAKVKSSKEKVLVSRVKPIKSQPRSYINLIYGAVTVVVLFLLVFFVVRTFTQDNRGEITQESAQTKIVHDNGNTYTVKQGDTLWSIAESQTGSGYNWVEIVEANQIKNPANVEVGTKLKIPKEIAQVTTITVQPTKVAVSNMPSPTLAQTTIMQQPSSAQQAEKITGGEYVIKQGDNLWDISIRAYGDGYKWVEVAKQNNIQNPDLIYPDTKLKLTR